MHADPDTLATALFVKTDDLLKSSPRLAPWRPTAGIAPQLSDAELVTLAVMLAMLGFTSEARWLRHACVHLRHLFPYLPKQPGYNKGLRKAAGLIQHVIRLLAVDTTLWSDDMWVVDSTPVECGRSRETVERSDLAGWAEYGYCARRASWQFADVESSEEQEALLSKCRVAMVAGSSPPTPGCDCLAHRFGNAADRPGRRPRYGSDMSDDEWALVRDPSAGRRTGPDDPVSFGCGRTTRERTAVRRPV